MGKIAKVIGGLFKPKLPEIITPKMPDLGSPEAKLAARKKLQDRGKRGREGTIYGGAAGGAYTGANLGGTA
jgi:hypothetical protein